MPPAHRRSPQRGFTLIELMIVVAIIGVLAAIAIPQLIQYMRKAKTAEALQQLEKIKNGARTYYMDQRPDPNGVGMLLMQFPATVATTPAVICCTDGSGQCMPDADDWDTPTWDALQFQMRDPHHYRYEFISQGEGDDAVFTARAYGDLDCDGDESTFAVYGEAQPGGDVMTSTNAQRIDPLE